MSEHGTGRSSFDDARQYFENQLHSVNVEFWRRVGHVDFRDKAVLDIGCGHGALSLHAAEQGAKYVVGVDIDAERIEFARTNIRENYPRLLSSVSFYDGRMSEIPGLFDIAISKDSFEHIADLAGMMADIAQLLAEGGVLIAGFSPLYYSPFGDHGRYLGKRFKVPWLPVVMSERALAKLASKLRGVTIRTAADVGLNKLTFAEFRSIISDQGWEVLSLRTNVGNKRGMGLMRSMRRIPRLERYFTINVYAQLRKPSSLSAR